MNLHWQFATSPCVRFGRGVSETLPDALREQGVQRPFVVTDAGIASTARVQSVLAKISSKFPGLCVFDGGQPEPAIAVAEWAIESARAHGADAVIGIGGGSNLDVAKMVAVGTRYEGSVRSYFGFGKVPGPVTPMIAVPTTAGTGSEVSHSSVLTDVDGGVKVSTLSPFLRPRLAIVDPALTDSCPATVTAHSGIDALVHAIEAFTNRPFQEMTVTPKAYEGRYPLTELLALEAIRQVGLHLVNAYENPSHREARDGMAYAALLAGMAFSNSGVGLVHALEYPIGALTHCSHGEGNGLLLPYVMEFNLPACQDQFRRIASMLTPNPAANSEPEQALEAVKEIQRKVGIRTKLSLLGLAESDISTVVSKTMQIERLLTVNARRPSEQDLIEILHRAM